MSYKKLIVTTAALSLVVLSSAAFAATGTTDTGVTAGNTAVSATNVTAGAVTVGTGTSTTSLEVTGAPRLVKKTDTTITLEWDAVPAASAYIVKYSKISVATSKDPNAQYDNETDQVTATGTTIDKLSSTNEKLAPSTSYYFSVVAVDKDGKESDTFSDELMVVTDATGAIAASGATVSSFAVSAIAVIDNKTLSVEFSTGLSDDPLNVKVTKTSDNSDVMVQSVTKDATKSNTANVTLASALDPSSSYTLTVLSAKDGAGNNIQEGVNGLKEFTTPEKLAVAAGSEVISGATLSGAVNPAAATTVATGTQENLLVLAALILSLAIVFVYRRKLI